MERMRQLYVFLVAMLVAMANGMPTGAPESACDTLQPKHKDYKPQPASTFPYMVIMSKNTYSSATDKISVLLQSVEGTPAFKGFLLAARDEAGKPFGSWAKSTSGHEISCSAITHNDNKEKTSVSFTWMPPANATSGKITITAAVVQNVSTFWTHIPAKVGPIPATRRSSAIAKTVPIIATTSVATDNKNTSPPTKQKSTPLPKSS